MIDIEAARSTSDTAGPMTDRSPSSPSSPTFPPLYRTLEIARRGCEDPLSLNESEIEDLARTMLMHYAHMGIA